MRRFAIVIGVALIVACTSPPIERSHYLLRSPESDTQGAVESEARVGIRRVEVASYLDQPGIVVQVNGEEVRPARNHLWAEPLPAGIRLYLRSVVADALGEAVGIRQSAPGAWDVAVEVSIEALHGRIDDGSAHLVARYEVFSGGRVSEYRFAQTTFLQTPGYDGLVAAEKVLLAELGRAIAASVEAARQASAS